MRPLRLRREQTCQGPLVLIDRAHPLQEGAPPELVPVDRLHPQVLLERRAARLLAACIRSVGGGRTIVPVLSLIHICIFHSKTAYHSVLEFLFSNLVSYCLGFWETLVVFLRPP